MDVTPASWREPMLAQALRVEDGLGRLRAGEWTYERKLDGLRCIAVRNGEQVDLWSRNHLSFNARFPHIASAVASTGVDNICLDGELVAFDGDRTSFSLLQQGGNEVVPVYVAFDLLHLLGRDTTVLPLHERIGLLARVVYDESAVIRPVQRLEGDPGQLLAAACRAGWEGLVAKRSDSPYRGGRSGDWRKLKCTARQELVVGGWTEPSGSRVGLGALLLGYYGDGGLRYAGRVGTGFSDAELARLHSILKSIEVAESPFAENVPERQAHWTRPALVAEVAFTEWTRDGRLRHPSYLGLRDDKAPRDVRREIPGPV